MSKAKPATKDSSAKTQPHTSPGVKYTCRKKRKHWMTEKFIKIKPPPVKKEKPKVQQPAPPKDELQFSANWKLLQETLKASQPEKKPPVAPQPPNGAVRKNPGAGENHTKQVSKNSVRPKQAAGGAKAKHKPAHPDRADPKDSKVPEATRRPAPPERNRDGGKPRSEPGAKKPKPAAPQKKATEEDIWFDDVDPDDIEATVGAEAADVMRRKQGLRRNETESSLVKAGAFEGLTRAVAIDCEMVGVGPDGEESILARVSIVNHFGKCIYDKYVKPTEKVTDYRTFVSGIRPADIKDGEDLQVVQKEVADILQGRIVVGHALHNDLKILLLDHPKKKIRDTQKYKPFRRAVKSGRPALKVLCREILNVKVQQGEHSSVQDAQATMRLYTMVKKHWEAEIKASHDSKDSAKKNTRKPKLPKNKRQNLKGL
ncbi:RNA exonuclease 4 [Pungitius pungitius]|uniref:RNA exonuclease 4 n=1 Tax=Pungitius pungitius TaxID=134920 RepID=UPI002E1249B0